MTMEGSPNPLPADALESIAFLRDWIGEIDEELERRARVKNAPTRTGAFPKVDRFKRLKEQVSILDWCDRYGPILRKRGRVFVGLCPFPDHNEKTPSFKVDPERDNFYCFGCHRHGDIFHLAMAFFQVQTNYEALLALEKAFGVSQVIYEFPTAPVRSGEVTEASPYSIPIR